MFARTQRLTLRPGWIEDAPELAHAIAHHEVVRNLSRAPWPYTQADAEAFLMMERAAQDLPSFVICATDEAGFSRIVGCVGLNPTANGGVELGYWITPTHWGRGYATEAGRAVIDIARTLRIPRISASHFIDNPASGRVLRKLGFKPTGQTRMLHSLGRGGQDATLLFEQQLSDTDCSDDPYGRIAA